MRWLSWITPEDLIDQELAGAADEGRDLSAIAKRWAAGGADRRALAIELLDACDTVPLPVSADEPESYADIAASWSVPPPVLGTGVADLDRVHGGWVGRAVGCLLGKPVEKIPREGIREILDATGRWPLSDYFTAVGLPPDVARRWPWNRRSAPTSLVENIDGMPEDDDLNFALIALLVLETHGRDLTGADVAQAWLDFVPGGRVFTAERVAYRNLLDGMVPPETARHHNPYREWIGAQIRTDVYGWAAPGRPADAAALAHRDAEVSHVRGGVHGAMWVAAMTSAAVVASDVDTVLDAGESVLPPRSRFAAAVREARELGAAADDWESVVDAIYARHGHLHWVHGRNNGALAAAALAFGHGEFDRSICAVVAGGWDTDSNGATVGSIVGALSGAAAIPESWTAPLKGRLASSVAGFDGSRFADLAARTLVVAA
jgi:ADP-ribosylglycohydrolase